MGNVHQRSSDLPGSYGTAEAYLGYFTGLVLGLCIRFADCLVRENVL